MFGARQLRERNSAQSVVQAQWRGNLGGLLQGLTRLLLGVDLDRAFAAHRKMMSGTQIRVHSQLTVYIRGNGLGGQMLGRCETRWTTRRSVLATHKLHTLPVDHLG